MDFVCLFCLDNFLLVWQAQEKVQHVLEQDKNVGLKSGEGQK